MEESGLLSSVLLTSAPLINHRGPETREKILIPASRSVCLLVVMSN